MPMMFPVLRRAILPGLLLPFLLTVSASAQAAVEVFACEPEWAALSRVLVGPEAEVFSATHAAQDPHHVQARPSLIARLRGADLVVCTGAGLESGWMPMLQRRARNPRVLDGAPGYFEATDQVTLLDVPASLDRAQGHLHGDGNPHIQLDPRRLLTVAEALSQRLQQIDPANAAAYQARLAAFTTAWRAALQRWEAQAAPLRGRAAVVHHREWRYLLDWLDMRIAGALEPKPGVPPTLAHLAELKGLQADLIIHSPLNDPQPAQWLQAQTGQPVVELPHTVGAVPDTASLEALFDTLVDRLVAAIR